MTGDHPRSAADYSRLVRKHDHYFALAGTVDRLGHLPHRVGGCRRCGPPPETDFDALNAAMLQRAAARRRPRAVAVGTPLFNKPQATVTDNQAGRSLGLAGRAGTVPLARPGHRTPARQA